MSEAIDAVRVQETAAKIRENVQNVIVGKDEADIKKDRVSISSPIARAMIGKSEGDVVEVSAPSLSLIHI